MSRTAAVIALTGCVLWMACGQGEGGGNRYICEDGETRNWWCPDDATRLACKNNYTCNDGADREWFCTSRKNGGNTSPTYAEACEGQYICLDGDQLYWACPTPTARDACEGQFICLDAAQEYWSCSTAELAAQCDGGIAPQQCSSLGLECVALWRNQGTVQGLVNQCNPVGCTPW